MAKLNLRDISIAYAGATVASISTATVGGFLWEIVGGETNYSLVVSSAWLLAVGLPSTLVSMDVLRRKLGEKSPTTVRAVGGGARARARAIPVTAGSKQGHVFLSSIAWMKPQLKAQPETRPEIEDFDLPQVFTVSIDDNDYSVTTGEIEDFLRVCWKRQRSGNPAFSRPFWTRQHRPRLKPLEYYTRLNVLLSVEGLILDRSKRRSGRLAVPPMAAIKALQGQFSLV